MDAQVLQAEAEVTTGGGVAADAAIDGLGPRAGGDDGDGEQAPQPAAEEVPGGPHACYEAEFEVRPGFRIGVSSVAGVSTCVWVPPLKAVFDCGLCLGRTTKYSHVFVSHGHMDHCSACPQHTSLRGLQGSSSAATYVVPEAAADPLEAVFANFRLLNDSELPAVVAAAAPGQEFRMANNNTCVAFETFHRVPSVGYAVYSHRKKLKAEYVGLESSEIGALAKQGVAVSESVAVCEFAYTGDTTIEAVEANECVRTARVLVMECTIVDDKLSPEVTHERGHIHLEDIAARADMFENEAIVLMHFSARHHANDIVEAVQATLPPDLASRVWLALSRHKMEAGGAASGFGDE